MKKTFALFISIFAFIYLNANNIQISNLFLTGQNTNDHYISVQFDISWENSWRSSSAPNNWDAAWVFVKYRIPITNGGDGLWKHALLNNTGHTAPSGSIIEVGLLTPSTTFNNINNPGLGVFIYRNADGTGTFDKTGFQLRWNYGVNGISDNDIVEIQVYAIEMVYVPKGTFTVGSGGTETGSFTNGSWTSGATIALSIATENALTIAHSAGNLWGTSSSGVSTIGPSGTLSALFPKGYAAFYCMKYEISQQEYVDFLNSLTTTQATNRYYGQTTWGRNGITVVDNVYITTLPYLPCNYLSWADIAAYLDWSGLRPMTELEFEKACRGTETAVANEYAWGTNTIVSNAYTLSNIGTNNEVIATNYSTTVGNASYSTTTYSFIGPVRVGIFAGTSGNINRVTAGATYYGIMEMSGNEYERPITVGNVTGRAFTGTHGNGTLDATGNANPSTWPGTDATGAGLRGGAWSEGPIRMLISARNFAAYTFSYREYYLGGRGVRSSSSCGYSFGIYHETSGGVAPVDKTVTYSTITNIPGELSKCWITSNLGSDHQATAVDDATEASAGWYWQFNRKQGYKHDGISRIPNTTWIDNINENLDWQALNDPCALELGSGWHIPTKTEWTNVVTNGGWTNWNGPWNSGLKLHAAGIISLGELILRDWLGQYWSSTQSPYGDYSTSWIFAFKPVYCIVGQGYLKHGGFSLRCLKD